MEQGVERGWTVVFSTYFSLNFLFLMKVDCLIANLKKKISFSHFKSTRGRNYEVCVVTCVNVNVTMNGYIMSVFGNSFSWEHSYLIFSMRVCCDTRITFCKENYVCKLEK